MPQDQTEADALDDKLRPSQPPRDVTATEMAMRFDVAVEDIQWDVTNWTECQVTGQDVVATYPNGQQLRLRCADPWCTRRRWVAGQIKRAAQQR